MIRALFSLLLLAFTAPLMAQIPLKIYAQDLVDRTVAANPDLLVIVMHVTPPTARENVIIASNIGRIGKPGDEDDMRVIDTGKPNLEVAHSGDRFEVELPLHDVNGATIGALGLVWPYRAGQDKAAFAAKADRIRDGLAKRTLNAANLMEPYLLDPRATTRTRAQKLVEATVTRHPEIKVLALRGQSKTLGGFVLLGSNFGRHGKKAVAEQVAVFQRGEPAGVVHADIKRYSVDVPLLDRDGRKAGLMTVSYPWKSVNDEKALIAKALALREELRPQIASAEQLEELDP
jgi:hypothetical protein